jgi:Domain of unknown function (DUF4157)
MIDAGVESTRWCNEMIRNWPSRERHPAPPPARTLRAAVSQVAAAPASSLKRREGEPLDAATRAAAEHDLGHDFSKVRVHYDDDAAHSAEQLGALAFTVGSAIAFAPGRYMPATTEGRGLLLHELGHVAERSAAVGFGLDPAALPGFDQGQYGSCGAASIVTALVLWDRERHDPTSPNTLVVTACDIALVYMDDHQTALKATWENRHPGKGSSCTRRPSTPSRSSATRRGRREPSSPRRSTSRSAWCSTRCISAGGSACRVMRGKRCST